MLQLFIFIPFFLKGGPTNSGKTYHALKSLEAAGKGLYCGPLRLLALEVYEQLNRNGSRFLPNHPLIWPFLIVGM